MKSPIIAPDVPYALYIWPYITGIKSTGGAFDPPTQQTINVYIIMVKKRNALLHGDITCSLYSVVKSQRNERPSQGFEFNQTLTYGVVDVDPAQKRIGFLSSNHHSLLTGTDVFSTESESRNTHNQKFQHTWLYIIISHVSSDEGTVISYITQWVFYIQLFNFSVLWGLSVVETVIDLYINQAFSLSVPDTFNSLPYFHIYDKHEFEKCSALVTY